MIRRPPRSTLFPTRRSSDLFKQLTKETQALTRAENNRSKTRSIAVNKEIDLALDRKSTRLNSSHVRISYAVFCLKKKKKKKKTRTKKKNIQQTSTGDDIRTH